MKKVMILLLLFLFIPFRAQAAIEGTFNINKEKIELGDSFIFSGELSDNEQPIEIGFVLVNFKNENAEYNAASTLVNGKFSVETMLALNPDNEPMPAGKYTISVTYNDGYGNTVTFDNIDSLRVDSELTLTSTLNRERYKPGQTIAIKSTLEKPFGGDIEEAEARYELYGKTYMLDITKNKFEYEILVPEQIKSGEHTLLLQVQDNFGNRGSETISLEIIPKPTSLENSLSITSFLPGETVIIIPFLYDQAGDPIEEKIDITIKNPKGKIYSEKIAETGEEIEFELDEYALPGDWTIISKSEGFTQETKFTVEGVEDLLITLTNQVLEIKNIGNLDYTEDLEIELNSGDYSSIVKKITKLRPGESMNVELFKEARSGIYDLRILNTEETLNGIEITDARSAINRFGDFFTATTGSAVRASGSSRTNSSWIFLIVIVGIFGVFFYYKFKGIKKTERVKDRERRLGEKRKTEMKTKLKSKIRFGKATDEDIRDFKARILKDIETQGIKTEEKSFDVKPIIKDGAKTTIFKSKVAEPEKKFSPMSRNEQIKYLLHLASESNKEVEEFDKPLPRKERTIILEDKKEEPKKDNDNKGVFSMFD
ncbi:MAG: hypothetical protein ABIJ20_02150 [Nanoarchaeota archaeon]|nr:hypothetical protein [Nanoarchaeota archaeon]MBU1445276.1 hypothetical protein [Nanoarchaeota archaeon]MBU2406792.1 hypothetical protein [Nanoarchaeota archaeon]MBU2420472.1 hypothetical protein [Nanoarchaeota archaeon]MBU2475102.1 hypothetical protein [Nanoarchaeota archaeon]